MKKRIAYVDVALSLALALAVYYCSRLCQIASIVHAKYLAAEPLYPLARVFAAYGAWFYVLCPLLGIAVWAHQRFAKVPAEAVRSVAAIIAFAMPLLVTLSVLAPLAKLTES